MKPNIPLAVRHLIEQYRRFLRTSYRFLDPHRRSQPKTFTAKIAETAKTRQLSSLQRSLRTEIFRAASPSLSGSAL